MIETIRTYNDQFRFVPQIVNEHLIKKNFKQIILCGMGGSHLPAGILKTIKPGLDLYVHKDYDLPPFDKNFFETSLMVASSFSGNTEEVISFYKKTKQLFDMPVVCITTGGELLSLAKQNNDPFIVLPQSNFVPRTALGYSSIALASLLHDKEIQTRLSTLSVNIAELEEMAISLSKKLEGKTPLFYASNTNMHLAYNWKIKCNETAKTHAFYNVFPEANHNELEGYEFIRNDSSILPVLLRDDADDQRIQKRFDAFCEILKDQHIDFEVIDITHLDPYQKVFRSIILGDLVTARIAEHDGHPIAEVRLIESFKQKLI